MCVYVCVEGRDGRQSGCAKTSVDFGAYGNSRNPYKQAKPPNLILRTFYTSIYSTVFNNFVSEQ